MESSRLPLRYDDLSPAQIRIFNLILACLLLVPVPWKQDMSLSYGYANRLNGNVEVNGYMVDPPGEGEFSMLNVMGRWRSLGEVMMDGVFESSSSTRDFRTGSETSKPTVSVPAAVRVGLEHAGQPTHDLEANMNYDFVPGGLIARPIASGMTSLANLANNAGLRELHTGPSHGMMVALAAYSDASGVDLAQGRHIAGTGGIKEDGTVTTIGSLPTKAIAANRANADVLLVPASQIDKISGLSLPGTEVVPVGTLQGAINWLSAPVGEDQ
jgi:hypothetical protein